MNKNKRYFLLVAVFLIICFNSILSVFAHPGRTDSNGGHWDRESGTYHFHTGEYTDKGSSNSSSNEEKTKTNKLKELQRRVKNGEKNISTDEFEDKTKKPYFTEPPITQPHKSATNNSYEQKNTSSDSKYTLLWFFSIISILAIVFLLYSTISFWLYRKIPTKKYRRRKK